MNENFDKINMLVENYPDLKASDNYKTLQKAIVDVEEHLQAARRLYNANVTAYNERVLTFPSSIVAKMNGFEKKEFFMAKEEQKKNVNIDL